VARFLPSLRTKGGIPRGLEVPSPFRGGGPESKALLTSYYTALQQQIGALSGDRARPWPIERAMAEGYDRVMWVFRAVEVIAGNASRLPFAPTRGARPGKPGKAVDDHPLTALLNRKANPLETGTQFRKRLGAQFLLSKPGAFVQVAKTYGGRPTRLDLLPPGRTRPIFGDYEQPITEWEVTAVTGRKTYLDADLVLWFRNPHPVDPFSGVTPLESAGLSIELDYFARLYNAMFVRNDQRPGGILAVKRPDGSAPTDTQMDRVEARFGRGPREAGKMTVLSGEIDFIDPAGSPRDLAYGDLSHVTKTEILSAFGVAESVLGSSADRTFSNAGQDLENFWGVEPMPAFLDNLATGWGPLLDDDITPDWDTSRVEALQRAKARQREEARSEVDAGLRSIKSYADLAGFGADIDDTPHTRALWVTSGKTPLPAREEDGPALGITDPEAAPAPGEAVPPAAAAVDAAGGSPALPAAPAATTGPSPQLVPAQSRTAAMILSATQGTTGALQTKAAAPRRRRTRAVLGVVPADEEAIRESRPDAAAMAAAEAAVAAALDALAVRFVERTVVRLQSAKVRKGTRHFAAEHAVDTRVGTKALDTSRAVDEDTWADDTQTVVRPYVEALAAAAAAAATAALVDDDGDEGTTVDAVVAVATAAAVAGALALVAASARTQARGLSHALNVAEQGGADMAALVARARGFGDRLKGWARGLATQTVVAAVEGARDSSVEDAIRRGLIRRGDVRRTWVSRRDGGVRGSHQVADGQTVRMGTSFRVGDALLRYPGDPQGPPREVSNCRCFVVLSHGVRRARLSA
jgi:HK97 family phage portal protein